MKQLTLHDFPLIHVEVTLGLRKADGTQATTRDLTEYLQMLNKERAESQAMAMTFKVFSGYSPYLTFTINSEPESVTTNEIVENVALLHLDYNPEGQAEERFDTLVWYIHQLMEKFGQHVAYAHFATDGGHRMLTFTWAPEPEPMQVPTTRYPNTPEPATYS